MPDLLAGTRSERVSRRRMGGCGEDEAGEQPRAGPEPGGAGRGLAFAEAIGLEPAAALEVLKGSMAYSRAMDVKGRKMIEGDFSVQARLSQHLKDVRLDARSRGRCRSLRSRSRRRIAG